MKTGSKINSAISQRILDKVNDLGGWKMSGDLEAYASPLRKIVNLYLGYIAGNQALSLLGRQIVLGVAIKVSFASGVVAFFASTIVNYICD